MIWMVFWIVLAAWVLTSRGLKLDFTPQIAKRTTILIELVLLLLGVVLVLFGIPFKWVFVVLMVITTGIILVRKTSLRALKQRRYDELCAAFQALAALVLAGMHPNMALQRIAKDFRAFENVASSLEIGASSKEVFGSLADKPGYEPIAELAAGWILAEQTGAPLAPMAVRLSENLRANLKNRRVLENELTSPRATGKLLAGLPIIGILLGFVAGGNPIAFLSSTVLGQWALAAAIVLTCLGLLWTEWLAGEL